MIIRRYIIGEIIKPAAAILTVLVAVFASYCSVTYLTDAVGGLMSPAAVALLIGLKIAMAFEVLLPTTLYLSVIIALARLYKDREMTALSACGVGLGSVLKYVFLVSLPFAALAAGASLFIRPEAYKGIYRIRAEAKASFDISRLESNRFLEFESGRYIFFADDMRPGRRAALNVFIRSREGDTWQVISAEEMIQSGRQKSGYPVMIFRNGSKVEFELSNQGGSITRFEQARYPIVTDAAQSGRYRRKAASTVHLLDSDRLEDVAELQWRLSIPLTTILLALLAVPLSRTNPRKGKYTQWAGALIIFATYFQLFVIAKTQVENGTVSHLIGIWWVPALLAVLILILLKTTGEVFYRR